MSVHSFSLLRDTPKRRSHCVPSLQIALQLFWLLSFFPEPLSMSAQSLIARDTPDRPQVVRTAWLLIRLAGFLAVLLAGLVAMSFLFGSYLFSPEQDIIDGVHDLVLPVSPWPLPTLFRTFLVCVLSRSVFSSE